MNSILFVDDDKPILRSLRRILHPLENQFKFSFADSSIGAMLTLDIVPVDIIVADMCMPGMNGLELLKYVSEKYPQIKRIMMTGKTDYEIYHDGREVSNYFLWKPIKPEALKTLLFQLTDQEVPEYI